MSKPKHTAKLVITSIVTSIIVVAIIALLFVKFLVPIYNISEDAIYSVLIKILPLILGFILIQIGVMAGKKNEDDYKDQIDKLPPNAYTDPLMMNPTDDPKASSYGSKEMPIRTQTIDNVVSSEQVQPTEVVKEVVKPVTIETVREVPVPIYKVDSQTAEIKTIIETPVEKIVYQEKEVPVEVVKEVPVEVVKEVIKEVPVEVVKEVPVVVEKEVIKEVPVDVIKEVIKEVPIEVVKEVPVEVVKEVIKEVPVEAIKEVPVEVIKEVEKEVVKEVPTSQSVQMVEDVVLDLDGIITEEIESAKREHYDLSMLYIYNDNDATEENIKTTLGEDYVFNYQLGCLVILPFNNAQEAEAIKEKAQARFTGATISLATLKDGMDKDKLLKALF